MFFSRLSLPAGYKISNAIMGACMGILSPIIHPLVNLYCKSRSDTPQSKRLWPSIIVQVADIYVLCAIFVFLRTPSSLVSTTLADSGLSYLVLGMPCLLGALHGAGKSYMLEPSSPSTVLLEAIWKWPSPLEAKNNALVLHKPEIHPSPSRLSIVKSTLCGSVCGIFLSISMPMVQSFKRIQEADYPSLQYMSDTINFYASIKASFILIGLFQLSPTFSLALPTTLGIYGIFRGGYLGYRLNITFDKQSLLLFSNHILEGGFAMIEPTVKKTTLSLQSQTSSLEQELESKCIEINIPIQKKGILSCYSLSESSWKLRDIEKNDSDEWVDIDLSSPSNSHEKTGASNSRYSI
jgi:hypothetical protein